MDKFLWAVRLYKTRSKASEAVKNNQVFVDGEPVKPSFVLKGPEKLTVKRHPIWRTYRIISLLKRRVGAKLVDDYIKDITPKEELDKLEAMKAMPGFDREKGMGRPTKKERRELDRFKRWMQ